jgi:two-component system chemotaxis response regulator CheY
MATVLVVDDAKFMRVTLTRMLENGDHTVVGEAENGRKAIELYRDLKPDIVTMDITMPVMTGIEAVKGIMEASPEAKIIICSAIGQQRMVVSAIEAGAKDFIVKPFDEKRVLESINRVLNF